MRKAFLKRFGSRFVSKWFILGIDMGVVAICFLLSVLTLLNFDLIRFPGAFTWDQFGLVTGAYMASFLVFRSFEGVVRHMGVQDARQVLLATSLATFLLFTWVMVSPTLGLPVNHPMKIELAFILLLFFFVSFTLISIRFIIKAIYQQIVHGKRPRKLVMIYGAGNLGLATQKMLENDSKHSYKVAGFLDDNPDKQKKSINGIPVYATRVISSNYLKKKNVREVIIAIRDIHPERRSTFIQQCLQHKLGIRSISPIENWINGELTERQIRPIRIEELLQRKPIQLDLVEVKAELYHKVVMITGAAGSIGSELARQVISYQPSCILLVDRSESALFELEMELKKLPVSRDTNIEFVLADVCNKKRMEPLMRKFRPYCILHAAANKHVPMMEHHPQEALQVNVLGTKVVADLAIAYGVHKFVMVSTDKAINPTNIMGATKRLAEMYIQSLNDWANGETQFITTRFGNVLGSTGSVIPIFKKQIEAGGPITVTHPEITRYFMTIPEACQLVLEAGVMGNGGEIFVFDMGSPVKIVDLANQMIRLSGLEPDKDIAIQYSGLRPGEKLFEELLADTEKSIPTKNEKILLAKSASTDYKWIVRGIDELSHMLYTEDHLALVSRIKELVPEFISKNSPFELLDQPEIAVNGQEKVEALPSYVQVNFRKSLVAKEGQAKLVALPVVRS